MMKLIFEHADGTLSVMTPAQHAMTELGLNETEFYAHLIVAHAPPGATYRATIAAAALPSAPVTDWQLNGTTPTFAPVADPARHFRAAWRWNGAAVIIDAAQESAQRKATARAIRDTLLHITDTLYQRESEQGGPNLATMRARRQGLRDLGTAIDADPVNLVWPDLTTFGV